MNSVPTKKELSVNQQQLLELMQRINFGCIEGLTIKNGEPQFDPSPKVVRDIKLGASENGPRRELTSGDFTLKAQVVDLFSQFESIGEATIKRLDVKHGLPFLMSVIEG